MQDKTYTGTLYIRSDHAAWQPDQASAAGGAQPLAFAIASITSKGLACHAMRWGVCLQPVHVDGDDACAASFQGLAQRCRRFACCPRACAHI